MERVDDLLTLRSAFGSESVPEVLQLEDPEALPLSDDDVTAAVATPAVVNSHLVVWAAVKPAEQSLDPPIEIRLTQVVPVCGNGAPNRLPPSLRRFRDRYRTPDN
ncbi:hypothetical protein Vqi01_41180 [Micromonospora qiuiae]|uniref:Uncharacterized protein n=1 Tax=Micromonospora qiuiae TaxID=502268 RepID=A0ABQ4JFK6_9ACTN|nr:hypothetical protein Vqi01_41180 [Micromonospora qiuiae]